MIKIYIKKNSYETNIMKLKLPIFLNKNCKKRRYLLYDIWNYCDCSVERLIACERNVPGSWIDSSKPDASQNSSNDSQTRISSSNVFSSLSPASTNARLWFRIKFISSNGQFSVSLTSCKCKNIKTKIYKSEK